jgi:hypothetical protein
MLREFFGSCSVHHVSLLHEEVPVRYGLIRFPPDYLQAKKTHFPNAYSFVLGGCLVSPTNPMARKMSYCPKCREAENAWHEARAKK